MSESLTPNQAADLLGVGASTVRRWCDSNKLKVQKTTGGHRRILKKDLITFAKSNGLEFFTNGPLQIIGKGGRCRSSDELGELFYRALIAGDQPQLNQMTESLLFHRGTISFLCDEVIAPTMHRLGKEWAEGSLPIFREHMATQIIESTLHHASNLLEKPTPNASVALSSALSGDRYSLGSDMCALVFKQCGYKSISLGADTPTTEILKAAKEFSASIIALSLSNSPSDLHDLISLCEEADSLGILVALGGRRLGKELRMSINPDFMGDTMAHLEKFATKAFVLSKNEKTLVNS